MTQPPTGGPTPPPGPSYPGQPEPGQGWPGQGFPGQPMASPVSGQPNYGHPFPTPQGYPPYDAQQQQPPAKRKRGLLIASIVLAVVLVLCGGGGLAAFLLLRGDSGEGATEPVAAADAFLRAVYVDHDPDKAAALVCPSARDTKKITKKIDEIKGYAKTYKNPRFRWETPKVDDQNAERAIVSVKLRMITGDEKFSDQQLKLTVVQETGWWVCEVG